MASLTFQERFRNKSSIITQSGNLEVNPYTAIKKPSEAQVHSSVFQSSAHTMIKPTAPSPLPKSYLQSADNSFYGSHSVALTEPIKSKKFKGDIKDAQKRLPYQSLAPSRAKNSTYSQDYIETSEKLQVKADYKPYTLKDYNIIKPKQYYQLGGLGPASVGNVDWLKKKELNDKRWKYGKDIYFYNAAKLPMFPLNVAVKTKVFEDNSRQRALEFAKKITKPPLKLQNF